MKVRNMESTKGNKVANQFIIEHDNKIYFQSYNSVIAVVDKKTGNVTMGRDFDYSVTTSKYLHIFMRDTAYYFMNEETKRAFMEQFRNQSGSYSKMIQKCIDDNIFSYDENL